MTDTLKARVEKLPRYPNDDTVDMIEGQYGEWLSRDDVLALFAPAPAPPVEAARTCATCRHHTDWDWRCAKGVQRPGRYVNGIPRHTFGCTLHEALPASPEQERER